MTIALFIIWSVLTVIFVITFITDIILHIQDKRRAYRKFLFVEDGSVDLDELNELKETNREIKVIVYRTGGRIPELKNIKE